MCDPEVGKRGEEKDRGRKEDVLGGELVFDEFAYWMGSVAQMRRREDSCHSKSGTFVMVRLGKEPSGGSQPIASGVVLIRR